MRYISGQRLEQCKQPADVCYVIAVEGDEFWLYACQSGIGVWVKELLLFMYVHDFKSSPSSKALHYPQSNCYST